MGRYASYDSYKESGAKFLGRVPAHWGIGRLKFEVDSKRQITYGIVQCGPDVPGGIPYVRPVDMTDEQGLAVAQLQCTTPEIARAYRRSSIQPGDLVISIGPSFGKVMVTSPEMDGANLTQGTARVAIKPSLAARFFFWVLRAKPSNAFWVASSSGATFAALTLENLAETPVALPTAKEQEQVADFLDHETAKIDRLIARQERLIGLLKEKRQAVISHAVTQGLNPDAPMKDSGVEWLGEVPAYWGLEKLKYTAIFKGGGTPSKDSPEYWVGDIPWVSPKDMKSRHIADSQDKITLEAVAESSTSMIGPNRVLIVVRSGILQRTIPVAVNMVPVTLNQDMKAIDFRNPKRSEFFSYFVQGLENNLLLAWRKQGATVESIEQEYLGNTIIPMPPPSEIDDILGFIDTQLTKYEVLTEKATNAIELLKEHRVALISAAVTGKIDVRGWQKPNNQPQEAATAASA